MGTRIGILMAAMVLLPGCGASCESLQEELQDIGKEIRNNPETALDRAEELDGLRQKLEDLGCMG